MRFSFQNMGFELGHGDVVNLPFKKTMTGKGLVISFYQYLYQKIRIDCFEFLAGAARRKKTIINTLYYITILFF
jgi:hypothetical protein